MDKVNWGVVNNGLDFLDSSVDHLANPSNRNLKYAVLHLFASIETLIKARLILEHWTLVLADVGAANVAKFKTGDFRSVGVSQALQRLRGVGALAREPRSDEVIKDVEKLRNRAAFFSIQGETPERVSVVVARGLDYMLNFVGTELLPAAPPNEAQLIEDVLEKVRDRIGKIQVLVQQRMRNLEPELARFPFLMECPVCRQPSLAPDAPARCLYCLFSPEYAEDLADAFSYTILRQPRKELLSGSGPPYMCAFCAKRALVGNVRSVDSVDVGWLCFSCGERPDSSKIHWCLICGEPYDIDLGNGNSQLCPDCSANLS